MNETKILHCGLTFMVMIAAVGVAHAARPAKGTPTAAAIPAVVLSPEEQAKAAASASDGGEIHVKLDQPVGLRAADKVSVRIELPPKGE
jgi:hypothetical protein